MDEFPRPKPGDTLIKEDGLKVLLANWHEGQWYFYADAFKEAADKLVEQVEDHWDHDDKQALPILYLYRHYVELKLKSVIFQLDAIGGTQIRRGLLKRHQLIDFWNYAKANFGCCGCGPFPSEEAKGINALIKELSDIDPESMVFRYPQDLDGNMYSLPADISMQHLKDTMQKLTYGLSIFEGAIDSAKAEREIEAEIAAEHAKWGYDY